MRTRWIVFFLITLMCVTSVGTAEGSPTVNVDGQQLYFDVQPIIENDTTLVPLRALCEAMGATVTWNDEAQSLTATKGDTVVLINIGSSISTVNGKEKLLDIPAKLVQGRTIAPLRFLGEAFGGTVQWNPVKEIIYIASEPLVSPLIGTSKSNPVPMGQSYFTAGGYEITVNKLIQGSPAWNVIQEARISPQPPETDMMYVIVTYTIKDVLPPIEPVHPGLPSLTGSSNISFNTWDADIYLPLTRTYRVFSPEMYPGGPATGSTVFYVPSNESEMQLIWSDIHTLDSIYFEIH